MNSLMYLGPRKLEIRETEKPTGDIVVKVKECGICGTDLKTYLKGHPMFKPPTILGHECIGEIDYIKNENSGFKKGDFVAVAPYFECSECENCKNLVPELCKNKSYLQTGCFTEFVSMSDDYHEKGLIKIPDLDPVYSLSEPLACVLNGFEKIGEVSDILIVGGGPMGTLFSITARDKNIKSAVSETSEWRREYLKKEKIELFKENNKKYDSIILAVNKPELVEKYLPMVRDGGSILLFSGYPKNTKIQVDPYDIHYREVKMTGSFGYAYKHFEDAVELIKKNPENYKNLITHHYNLENSEEAFHLLEKGKAMKIVLGF